MEEKSLHIVIVGHVDHGKSTLIGRLFYDTGCLPQDKLEQIKTASESLGKELEFAFVMDHLEEERQRGITIDIAHTFFKTEKRKYVIIDAPGHKEFLKNMISGVSQAEAALLLVDISEGVKEQTQRHCYILNLLGIQQVAVVVNKMDLAGYSEQKFKDFEREVIATLGKFGIQYSHIIPISAKLGDNVAKATDKLSWFGGPTVLEELDGFNALKVEEKDLRFPVQDIYAIDGAEVAVGRVEAGILKKDQELLVLPEGRKCKVMEIRKFMEDDIQDAPTGDCIGVVTDGEALTRGQILVDNTTSTITDSIRANIFWMIDKDYKMGIPVVLRSSTQEIKGTIEKIYQRFDPAAIEVIEKDATTIKPAEIAEVEIKLEKPVVIDKFSDIPEMGRFVLEHSGHPVAGGIII